MPYNPKDFTKSYVGAAPLQSVTPSAENVDQPLARKDLTKCDLCRGGSSGRIRSNKGAPTLVGVGAQTYDFANFFKTMQGIENILGRGE